LPLLKLQPSYVLYVVQVKTELYYTQHIHHYGLDILRRLTTA